MDNRGERHKASRFAITHDAGRMLDPNLPVVTYLLDGCGSRNLKTGRYLVLA